MLLICKTLYRLIKLCDFILFFHFKFKGSFVKFAKLLKVHFFIDLPNFDENLFRCSRQRQNKKKLPPELAT